MNLFPVHTYEPKDRPWVIRMLRYLSFLRSSSLFSPGSPKEETWPAPGALFRIRTGGGFDNHHPSFTADPSALLPTARFFATLAERELAHLANARS